MNATNDMNPYDQPFSFASWLQGWVTKIKKVIKCTSYEKILAIKSKVAVLRKFVPLNFDNP